MCCIIVSLTLEWTWEWCCAFWQWWNFKPENKKNFFSVLRTPYFLHCLLKFLHCQTLCQAFWAGHTNKTEVYRDNPTQEINLKNALIGKNRLSVNPSRTPLARPNFTASVYMGAVIPQFWRETLPWEPLHLSTLSSRHRLHAQVLKYWEFYKGFQRLKRKFLSTG